MHVRPDLIDHWEHMKKIVLKHRLEFMSSSDVNELLLTSFFVGEYAPEKKII